jgi:uncharacterized protein
MHAGRWAQYAAEAAPLIGAEESANLAELEPRLGRAHIQQRLRLERDKEARASRRWPLARGLIPASLWLAGLLARGQRNALAIEARRHDVLLPRLPGRFDDFTILQLSDLHLDTNDTFVEALIEHVRPLSYDLCVLTGDYRERTFGPFQAALDGLAKLRPHLKTDVYAVLGNHDTLRLVPGMEALGYKLLLNESARLRRGDDVIYLAGIEDAHFYCLEDFERATRNVPSGAISILLSHTPEPYRQAARAGFDLMLSGHTHGGQICLPGGIPVLTHADSPRAFARGPWRFEDMMGYTSAGAGTCTVDVRLNCPPEITLHRLRKR